MTLYSKKYILFVVLGLSMLLWGIIQHIYQLQLIGYSLIWVAILIYLRYSIDEQQKAFLHIYAIPLCSMVLYGFFLYTIHTHQPQIFFLVLFLLGSFFWAVEIKKSTISYSLRSITYVYLFSVGVFCGIIYLGIQTYRESVFFYAFSGAIVTFIAGFILFGSSYKQMKLDLFGRIVCIGWLLSFLIFFMKNILLYL